MPQIVITLAYRPESRKAGLERRCFVLNWINSFVSTDNGIKSSSSAARCDQLCAAWSRAAMLLELLSVLHLSAFVSAACEAGKAIQEHKDLRKEAKFREKRATAVDFLFIPTPPAKLAIQQSFEGLTMGKPFGRGASSVVYAATMRGKAVAVKKARSLAERDEIMAEAQLMAQLVHPNIMTAHMLICNQHMVAFTMDLMKISLDNLTMPVSLDHHLEDIAEQVLEGLVYLEGRAVLHRDIKPGNLMVRCLSSAAIEVQIGDFGDAITLPPSPDFNGNLGGTPAYFPPDGMLTFKRDIFSLGVSLRELMGWPGMSTTRVGRLSEYMTRPLPARPFAGQLLEAMQFHTIRLSKRRRL